MTANRSRSAHPAKTLTHRDLMLLASAPKPFSGAGWIFELKFDGVRVLAIRQGSEVRLLSRTGQDLSRWFPEVAGALHDFPDCAIDGELVVLDAEGFPHHERLQARSRLMKADAIRRASRAHPAVIFAFDLLSVEGRDCRRLPLVHRKSNLLNLVKDSKRIVYADHVEENGQGLYDEAKRLGLEGIVAKRAAAPYTAGRSSHWMKIKTPIGRDRDRDRSPELARWTPGVKVRQ
jgi:bifunctional non-homologous end joining protein LigD